MEQVSNATKVDMKLDNEGLRLSFGDQSRTFYSLLIDELLPPLATVRARLEDHFRLATEFSCALACWIGRLLDFFPLVTRGNQVNLAGVVRYAVDLRRVEVIQTSLFQR